MDTMTFAEAGDAIYIDFECRAREIDRPAILGVVRPDGTVTQYVVDPALADAAVAQADCRVASLSDVLRELADECQKKRCRLVSWSSFDMKVILVADPPTRILAALSTAHFDALDIVPRWAATYGFKADKKKFETRNQLHKFFPLAGYRPDWRYEAATPAAWIRHVRAQMAASGGRYRHVNHQTKRDWQALLRYNRHDCLGLRHLTLRAAAETEKRHAYLDTVYAVQDDARLIKFRVGSHKAALDALLARHRAKDWAHISACNPGLETLSPTENRRRMKRLENTARKRGYTTLPGNGRDDRQRRPAEDTLFVMGIPEAKARRLAREFGQWAIVAGRRGEAARLVWCLDVGN
jgi:hypothetical protein